MIKETELYFPRISSPHEPSVDLMMPAAIFAIIFAVGSWRAETYSTKLTFNKISFQCSLAVALPLFMFNNR